MILLCVAPAICYLSAMTNDFLRTRKDAETSNFLLIDETKESQGSAFTLSSSGGITVSLFVQCYISYQQEQNSKKLTLLRKLVNATVRIGSIVIFSAFLFDLFISIHPLLCIKNLISSINL